MNIYDPTLFAPVPTFMRVPLSYEISTARAAILGVPFDCGTHPVRIGSRLGPDAVREQSALVRPYEPPLHDIDPLQKLGLVDCGNVKVVPSAIGESYAAIEEAVWRIVSANVIPVTIGGDGSVTLPQLRALHRQYPDLVVLHFDAHTDTYPGEGGERERYNTATTFTRAAEECLVDAHKSMHIGARGPVYMRGVFEHTRAAGYQLIPGADLFHRGIDDVLKEIHERLAGRPVYLCFDMDFFDCSCAPGVCAPTWGGASAREGLALIQGLAGLRFVAFDLNTVSPPHDVGGMTAFLASTCIHQFLFLACRSLGMTNLQAERDRTHGSND